MIASGLAVEGSHGLGHSLHFAPHHPHMATAFSAPPVPEFLRPLPKPAPLVPTRYNGGPPPTSGPRASKYDTTGAVNLAQQSSKDLTDDDYPTMFSSRFFAPPHHLTHYPSLPGPYGSLYPGHYTPILTRDRPGLPPPHPPPTTPHSPLEAFPSPHSAPDSPASTFSPPALVKVSSSTSLLSSSSSLLTSSITSSLPAPPTGSKERKFKVPSGKEGSLKHRILTTTPATAVSAKHLKRKHASNSGAEVPASFSRGSLIQLANGELRRVEDMRTEDFVSSAERSPALRLDPSTVVRIDPAGAGSGKEVNLITLSYGEHRTQVEIESATEHPYFVFNRGWASCDPDKSLATYGLKCHRLQVGDVCISLSPRPPQQLQASSAAQLNSTTSMQLEIPPPDAAASSSSSSCKKRRWSAPDQLDAILGSVGGVPTPPTTAHNQHAQGHRKAKD